MNFDQLGAPWRDGNEAASASQRLEQHVATARRAERFTAQVLRRDVIETLAGLLVIGAFGSYLLDRELLARFAMPAVAAAGMIFNILGSLYVIYRLHQTRLSTPASRLDTPVREFFESEVVRVEKQIALLKSVHLWYLGPFYLGVNLIFCSVEGLCAEFFVALAVVTVLFAFINALNRFAASTALTDLRNQLVWLRDSLGSDTAPVGEPPETVDHSKAGKRFALRWFVALLGVVLGGFVLLWALDTLEAERLKQPATVAVLQAIPPEVLQRYVGKYGLAPGVEFTVTTSDGQLMVGLTGQSTYPVLPRSETEWFYKVVEATLTFQVNDQGKCTAVELFQNGVRQTAKRIE